MKNIIKKLASNLRFNLSAQNNLLFIGFYKYFYNPKENSISYLLDRFSRSKEGKFTVIQVGANDGITHDPIHKFIKRDQWQGVLLEPQKYVYEKFLVPLYRKNKTIHPLNSAVGYQDGSLKLYKIAFSESRWATGLASFDKGVLLDSFKSGYVQQQAARENINVPDDKEKWIVSEEVDVVSPETLLTRYSIKSIDLLQIDAEGFDFEVIKMFNIEKNRPKVISFESSHLDDKSMAECKELLSKNDYALYSIGRNSVAMQRPLGDFERFFSTD